jgi:hypothetical protein
MVIDFFDQKVALNPATGGVVPNASAKVYAASDTSFSTPLAITDLTGVPLPDLIASPNGVYPAFKVPGGQTHVLARSSGLTTPIVSVLGAVLTIVPDPTALADGRVIVTSNGAYTTVPSAFTPIPDPTLGSDGQVLAIVDGAWGIANPTGGGGPIGGILDGGAP